MLRHLLAKRRRSGPCARQAEGLSASSSTRSILVESIQPPHHHWIIVLQPCIWIWKCGVQRKIVGRLTNATKVKNASSAAECLGGSVTSCFPVRQGISAVGDE